MKNKIRWKGKIYKRRSGKLVSGEIECPRCGKWVKVPRFSEKHFNEEYNCRACIFTWDGNSDTFSKVLTHEKTHKKKSVVTENEISM